MYIPKAFREDDIDTLRAFMREYSFATLVTRHNGELLASHLPFLLDAERGRDKSGPYGTLIAHMARANPQWRTFAEIQEALVIFQGPHTYISPSWYEDAIEQSVPTWNYAVVHAYGIPHLIEDTTALYTILQALVQKHESHFEKPWTLQPLNDFMQNKMRAIVGFQIPITRLEGKYKLSQNRSVNDQIRVVTALEEGADPMNADVAELMSKRRKKEIG
jgi:transcriptional regulator